MEEMKQCHVMGGIQRMRQGPVMGVMWEVRWICLEVFGGARWGGDL